MPKMMSRHELAKHFGRRVSRGEFERIFSRLTPNKLKTQKTVHGRDSEGNAKSVTYNPVVAARHPQSPKAIRKRANR